MPVEGHVGPANESGIGSGRRHIVADVRVVGTNVFEARDTEGLYSAVGYTAEEAVRTLQTRLPHHLQLWRVWFPGARESTEVELVPTP